MAHLAESVNARVGAAGAEEEDFLLGDLAGGFGDGALDGGQARLKLPAVELRAVVGDGELDVAHVSLV